MLDWSQVVTNYTPLLRCRMPLLGPSHKRVVEVKVRAVLDSTLHGTTRFDLAYWMV
jgi:hypothetical protein